MANLLEKLTSLLSVGGKTAVGLSIGTSSIKLAELSQKGKVWKLLRFGSVQLPDEVVVNREIMNPVALVECIRTLTNQMQLKNREVCISISGNALIVKKMTLELEGHQKKDLQDQIFWEAEQYLPFDISEVVMDYHLISYSNEGKAEVILVAVKKAVLESYMDCVTQAGLKPTIVDVDFFALQNLFEVNYPANPAEAVALVDLGASSMKIAVIANGIPIFTKDGTLGGKALTEEIQKALNLSYIDAESLKTGEREGEMPQDVIDLMNRMSENLAVEIKKGFDFYNASSGGPPISYVLLAGGAARMGNISKAVEEAVGLPTQVMNPFNAISYSPAVFSSDYLSRIASVAAVPIGLALRAGAGRK
jgi:type IV pilus assembly protein PilM